MSETKVVRVVLIRCGQTAWDNPPRMQGRVDLPLTQAGEREVTAGAEAWAAAWAAEPVGVIHCGPDEASLATARIWAKSLPVSPSIRVVDDLAELDAGLWEGLLESDLGERCARAWKLWQEDPGQVRPPEGETFAEAGERLGRAIMSAARRGSRRAATMFVLRPGALTAAHCWATGAPTATAWDLVVRPGSAVVLDIRVAGSRLAILT